MMSVRAASGLVLVLCATIALAHFITPEQNGPAFDAGVPSPSISITKADRVHITAPGADGFLVSFDGTAPTSGSARIGPDGLTDPASPGVEIAYRPTAGQWKSPVGKVPCATIVRARAVRNGSMGDLRSSTFLHYDHYLPVVSVIAPTGAFFDPDTGLYVPGHMIFRNEPKVVTRFARDGSWWKYPGNFQGRGKEWERSATMQILDTSGRLERSIEVGVRVNGQNSRGFPIKSLRILMERPVVLDLFDEPSAAGYSALVIRTTGNDYNRALMRDALQHQLCRSLPFEVSSAVPTVLYLSGVYWGIHYIRHRIDDDEIARRFDLDKAAISILEDAAEIYRGDKAAQRAFWKQLVLLERTAQEDPDVLPSLAGKYVDVNGFLQYMSAQMILGNTDWPDQNLKFWRWEAVPDPAVSVTDGRWRMIMGDSDLGMGYLGAAGIEVNMFRHVERKAGPIARLFRALMASARLRREFQRTMSHQLDGPLSSESMLQKITMMEAAISPEVEQHVARWRRPSSVEKWTKEVGTLKKFAAERPGIVAAHLQQFVDRSGDRP